MLFRMGEEMLKGILFFARRFRSAELEFEFAELHMRMSERIMSQIIQWNQLEQKRVRVMRVRERECVW